MGCDIHMWAEIKNDNKWYLYEELGINKEATFENDFFTERDYQLFALLADVRNCYDVRIEPISKPRGIPKDSSHGYLHRVEVWYGDGHSHSYFTLEELQKVKSENNNLKEIVAALEEEAKIENFKPNEIRIVFFFDN